MAKKTTGSREISSTTTPNHDGAPPKSSDLGSLLAKVEMLLEAGEPKKGIDAIARGKINSPWTANALGVCQLRLGNAELAVDAFRKLVLGTGGIHFRADVPLVFKSNFAVALALAGNIAGCLSALADLGEQHPAAAKLRAAIERHKKSLSLWERINWSLGVYPNRPVALDFPPGELT